MRSDLAHAQQIGRLINLGLPGRTAHGDAHGVGNDGTQPAVVGLCFSRRVPDAALLRGPCATAK